VAAIHPNKTADEPHTVSPLTNNKCYLCSDPEVLPMF
jgi:hypothetical protein